MKSHRKRLNGCVKRMEEDMQIRNMADATIDAYTYQVGRFCQFFEKPVEQLGPEEIRQYQLYLVNEKRLSWSTLNQAVCGIRFLYRVTLNRPWDVKHIPTARQPKKLPAVLSVREASRLFECLRYPKHRAILLICYASGLRLAEATHLRIADIDGDRRQFHIRNAKGGKDRYVPASPRLLNELRQYWRLDRPQTFLFPGKGGDVPVGPSNVRKACKLAAVKAGIRKKVTPHTMRHSFATTMLEAGVDLMTISKLLGHACIETTLVYLQVRRQYFERLPSPIDWMPVGQRSKWIDVSNGELYQQ